MGYSNVQGALNVLSSTSTQDLVVRGDTVHLGNLTAAAGYHNFGNLTAANLTVTGNFTITATNTQTTNSLTITNAETATALKVIQNETGLGGLVHNVAEFYDGALLAMVIDPFGNVGIHVTSSPGYSMTVVGGALVDTLTSQLYFGNASGLSNLNSSNLVNPLTSLQLSNTQSNITSLGTLVNLNVSGTANIANGWFTTANVTGGLGANTAFFNLLKTNTSNTSFLNASNAAVSNLLCSNLNVLATANMSALTVTGILNGGLLTGNASGLSNINSSNLVGNVASSNAALVVTHPSQPNITSVGVLSALTVAGIFQAGLLSGNASGLSNVNGVNVSTVPTSGVVTNPSQGNITSVGTLTSLTVSGVSQAGLFVGNASGLSNVNGANVSTVPTAGVVTNPAQTNITSVGQLTSLTVAGVSQAGLLVGNASGLSNLNSSNLVGNVANANVSLVVSQPSQPNVTSVGTLTFLTVAGVLQADLLTGNASGLSNVNGSNVSTVPTAGVVTNPSQGNITSVGQLTSLIVSGISQAGLLVGNASGLSNINSSNLVGNVANANVALVVSQPFQPNITQVGTLTGLFSSGNVTASFFTGQGNGLTNVLSSVLVGNVANANVALVVSQPLQPNITQVGTLTGLYSSGNIAATFFTGQGNGLTNVLSSVLVGNVANANVALVVSQPSQPNITSVGTLSSLTVSGVLQAGLLVGNASGLSNVNGANVSTVPTSGVVTNPAQTNITSVGQLTSLSVSGILNSNLFTGNASGLSNLNSSNLVGNVANANVALVVSQALQPNITRTGTLTALNVAGVSNLTDVYATGFTSNSTNTTFNFDTLTIPFVSATTLNVSSVSNIGIIYGQGNGISNVQSSVLVGNVANANVALVVSQPAQPNITSVGTLSSLSVQGILSSNLFVGNASALSNITGSNVSTVPTAQSVTVASQPNITSVGTLTSLSVQGILSSNLFVGNASALSNLNTANVTIGAFSASQLQSAQGNITSVGTLTGLTVSGNSNLQTLNVASIATPGVIPVSSGLFMNLNATYTLNSTGNWSGNIAGSITSNLFTLFAPNPVASWTTYGSNPLITGPTANGGFRFNQTGPYQFTVVLTSDNNIKTVALSSNTSDVHSNLANPGVWLYCYRISVGQDPSVPVQIPFYVDSTAKYYFIDFEAMNKADNIHRTAYTNVTAEGYTGSYVTLRPV
jgi:hypothetical protein